MTMPNTKAEAIAALNARGWARIAGADLKFDGDIRKLNAEISTANEAAKAAYAEVDAAHEALAGTPAAQDPNSEPFKRAQAANADYEAKADKLVQLREARDGLYAIGDGQGGSGIDANGPQPWSPAAGDSQAVAKLTSSPGAWMASALKRRAGEISNLPSHIQAAITTGGGHGGGPGVASHVSTVDESQAVIDLLAPDSVAFNVGIPVLPISASEVKIPRFTSLPQSGWVPEMGAFPKDDPGLEMLTVKPPKVGLRTDLSLEMYEDLTPAALALLQVQLLRSVSEEVDRGLLKGSGISPEPLGITGTDGVGQVVSVLDDLDPFAQAIVTLTANNATPAVLAMNPFDLGRLMQIGESDTSRKPLWTDKVTGEVGLRLPIYGTRIVPTKALGVGEAVMFDPKTLLLVMRREVDVAVDPYADLDHGAIGFRVYVRIQPIVGQPGGTVRILFPSAATAAASTDLITSPGSDFDNGDKVVFSETTGGAGITPGTTYFVRDVAGESFKVAVTAGGAAVDVTSNMTAGKVRRA